MGEGLLVLQVKRGASNWNFIDESKRKGKSFMQYDDLAREYDFSKIMLKLLLNRNITKSEEVEQFLNPTWEDMHDPFLLLDIEKSVRRLQKAIHDQENILIYGDYDVDGVSALTLLCRFIKDSGGLVDYIIPDRFEDGYGLSFNTLSKLERHYALVITVDCGINSVEEVLWLIEQGTEVIVTDHHEQLGELPPALAVINPKRKDSIYPFKELSGVGVALKLIWALLLYKKKHSIEEIEHILTPYLDLVALGTIADLVPLVDENRFFVKRGLKTFGENNFGLKALTEESGFNDKELNVGNIAFGIAPRINAAGRLGSVGLAVELLMEENSYEKAFNMSEQLSKENRARQKLEKSVFEEAKKEIIEKDYLDKDWVLVLGNKNWHEGVIGIAASKLVEEFYRPVILLSIKENEAKGSCRSIPPFDIIAVLNECDDYLMKYGGHKMAAGLTMDVNKLNIFREKINELANNNLSLEDLAPSINIDACIPASHITHSLLKELNMLGPHGIGNPRPTLSAIFQINNLKKVGKDKEHIKLSLSDGSKTYSGIWFNPARILDSIRDGALVRVAFHLTTNNYNQKNYIDLQIKDIKEEGSGTCIKDYRNSNKKRLLESLKEGEGGTVLVNTSNHINILVKTSSLNQKFDYLKFSHLSENYTENCTKDNTLILFDLPYDGEVLRKFVKKISFDKIYLLYCHEDKERNHILWQASIPNKGNINWIYQKFRHMFDDGKIDSESIKKYFADRFFLNTTWRLVSKCKEIFLELGIMKEGKTSYLFDKLTCELTKEVDLSLSKTYLEEAERFSRITWWEDIFLNCPPIVIYQLLFDDLDPDLFH